ncbi:MAG: hypothetical protein KF819_32650 [Labilithrix sp.]|nr:hypothetical protein [Labilithrix sp.]
MKPKKRRRAVLLFLIAPIAGAFACGSRTGLFGEDTDFITLPDGGRIPNPRRDAGFDVAQFDAPPPLDATPRDASRIDCPDAEATLVYLISRDYQLLSFNPDDGTITNIGNIVCPAAAEATPFSMAVDRKGVAYILFSNPISGGSGPDDGKLFRVSTATAACVATPFQPNQQGFVRFGMGFATDLAGPSESLYVAGAQQGGVGAEGLARIDVSTFALTKVGNFIPPIVHNAELTGTGDGRLYALYTKNSNNAPPTFIGEIDPVSGQVVGEQAFPGVTLGMGWAFAFWGGDFYMFTGAGGGSDVTRYRPSDNSTAVIATLPTVIVGAGVSTCAPAQ